VPDFAPFALGLCYVVDHDDIVFVGPDGGDESEVVTQLPPGVRSREV
jgi:hypothetical protein